MICGICLVSCAEPATKSEAAANAPAPKVEQAASPSEPEAPVAPAIESPKEPAAKAEAAAPTATAPANEVWKVVKGKIAGEWPKALLIGKFKNKKLPGFTSDICYKFKDFSLVETKSTGEMGSAELVMRHEPTCAKDFQGKYTNLKIIEGHFAGIAGDYVVVDGDDKTEGVIEFQLFDLKNGKEAYKGRRNPDEEFHITRQNGVTSVIFFAKIKVLCELAADGEACWKKVLEQNDVPKSVAMPDCKKPFEKAKVGLTEPALVTVRAKIANLKSPAVKFIGGKSTCVPEPQ